MTTPQPPVRVSSLREIWVPAYVPTALASIGYGAVLPAFALSARDLGASVETAALVVALIGVGQLIGDIPAGALAARIGEQNAMRLACLAEAVALACCWLAPTVQALAASVFLLGLSGSVLGLARQAFLTEAVVIQMRARALSTLGGVYRIGIFLGPFLGAAAIRLWGLPAAYAVGAVGSLAALVVLFVTPDIAAGHSSAGHKGQERVWRVVAAHRRVLLTLGVGVLAISAIRAARNAILPLWGDHIGLDAATTAVVFGLSGAVDMLLFYPGGWIMDRYGRQAVAVPALLIMGVGLGALPLADGLVRLCVVAVILGLGNGISAGIVMTLGADASPQIGRAQFLGGWRLMSDTGSALGPLVISVLVALSTLGTAALVLGALAWAGAAWLRRWIPEYDERLTTGAVDSP